MQPDDLLFSTRGVAILQIHNMIWLFISSSQFNVSIERSLFWDFRFQIVTLLMPISGGRCVLCNLSEWVTRACQHLSLRVLSHSGFALFSLMSFQLQEKRIEIENMMDTIFKGVFLKRYRWRKFHDYSSYVWLSALGFMCMQALCLFCVLSLSMRLCCE